jgi:hypothetical protein
VASPQEPGERPNRTVLDRPPGERYVEPDAGPAGAPDGPAPVRGIAWAAVVAIAGSAAITVLGGPLAISLGLLVVALLIGRFVGLALQARVVAAVVVALLGVLAGQAGIWLFARSEGGVLGPLDYLGQAFGWIVPAQFLTAAAVAWWTAR